jgi:hypothetical protein
VAEPSSAWVDAARQSSKTNSGNNELIFMARNPRPVLKYRRLRQAVFYDKTWKMKPQMEMRGG